AVTGIDFGVQPAPDLTATSFVLAAPATAFGQPVTVHYTLANKGAGDAGPFDVGVFLSNTGVITTAGLPLTTLHFAGLAAGATVSDSVSVTLPSNAPAGFETLSNDLIGFVIDPTNAVAESAANQSNQGAGIDFAQLG